MASLPTLVREIELLGPSTDQHERVTRTVIFRGPTGPRDITLVECSLSLTTELSLDGETVSVAERMDDSADEAFEVLTGLSPLAFDAMYFGVREVDMMDSTADALIADPPEEIEPVPMMTSDELAGYGDSQGPSPYQGKFFKDLRIVNPQPRQNGNV